jgi:chorismate mutase
MNIADWRRRMDEIDKKLVDLLNERSQCALKLAASSRSKASRSTSPLVKTKCSPTPKATTKALSHAAIRRLFERIIDEARSAERLAMHPGSSDEESK